MDAYQVWHRDGDKFKKVADVRADDLRGAVDFTQNTSDFHLDDPHEGQRWVDQAGVISAADGHLRSTRFGDIIIDPDGQEHVVTIRAGGESFGLRPTDTIHHQEYAAYLAEQDLRYGFEQPEPSVELEATPEDQERLFQSWRDDISQRPLAEKGVDYSDAPYAEPESPSYAEALKTAIARARYQAPPEQNAPRL